MAHTPGPWWIEEDGDYLCVCHGEVNEYGERDEVASLHCNRPSLRATQPANARLIAACPDMLDLLKDGTNLFLPPPDKIMSQDIAMPTAEAAAEWCRRASELINHVDGSDT
jgi:hypothetical protein